MQNQDAVNQQANTAAASVGAAAGEALAHLIIFIILVNLVFSFICALLARERGRSMLCGIAGGFIFGFWSLLYYVIAGDSVERRVEREEVARSKYRSR